MIIAQVSDFHVVAPGKRAYGRVDTRTCLSRAVMALNRLDPQPDLVIGSGDLVQGGAPVEYETLRAILAEMDAPFLPVAGNHDDRSALRQAFSDFGRPFEPAPFIQYVLELGGLRIIVLDTVMEGSDHAAFCETRAEWFSQTLAASSKPALVVMHHPPFMTGIPWMDPPTLHWTERLQAVVESHPGKIVGLLSGHIHRAIHTRAFGVSASSCPSTAHQVALDFCAVSAVLSHEAPGFQLHRWDGAALTTYTASLVGLGDDFTPPNGRTPHDV